MRRRRRLTIGLLVAFPLAAAEGQAQSRLAGAYDALRSGRYDEAIRTFRSQLEREASSIEAVRGLVRALSEVGRYAEAEEAARGHVRIEPESPELWNTLGEVLVLRGGNQEAARLFQRAIAAGASDSLDARLNLAVLRYGSGAVSEALVEFDRFIDIYNRDPARLSSEELTAVGTAVRYLGVENPQLYKDALRAYDEAIAADPADLRPRILVGELFLDKYRSADAAAEFTEVLAVNPNHPGALLGQARRARFDGQPEALELANRALEVNPNLVPARVFLAELRLELEDYAEAAAEAGRALEVNPSSLEALSVLAAARRLQGDGEAFEEARRKVFEINPRYSDFYTRLSDLSARSRLYGEAADFARQAVELDPRSSRGYALLGINELRLGAIEEGRKHLELAFEGDPYDIWTKNTLDLLDTFDEYDAVRTGRFVLFVDRKESALLSLYMGDLAEEAYDRLARLYGFEPVTPIRVEVYRSHADFSVRTFGLVGVGALGVSFGPVVAMDAPSARGPGEFNWGSTLWHEIAHTFHLGLTEGRVPRWFSEGLAVYEERRARPGWGDDVTPGFLTAYLQGRLLPVADLNEGFARPSYPEQLGYSYYEASLVCEFIEQEAGGRALAEMLQAYRAGLSTDAVFRRVLKTDVDAFGKRFFDYLETRFRRPLAAMRPKRELEHGQRPSRAQLESWAQEGDDFYALLTLGRALYEEGELEAALTHLEKAKSLFPEYAGPASPYELLAQVHRRLGEPGRAAAELEALTAINERNYRANLELAELRELAGDTAGAAAALERAVYIYPYEMGVHERLAQLYSRLGDAAAVIRERQAVLALDPVDRPEALYQLARAYFEAGDWIAARRTVLRALEEAPGFERAQDLLLEIRERGR